MTKRPNHRSIESGNSPLDFFTEFCISQQQRIRYGRVRIHERPFVPRVALKKIRESRFLADDTDETTGMNPMRDPELYDVEIRK